MVAKWHEVSKEKSATCQTEEVRKTEQGHASGEAENGEPEHRAMPGSPITSFTKRTTPVLEARPILSVDVPLNGQGGRKVIKMAEEIDNKEETGGSRRPTVSSPVLNISIPTQMEVSEPEFWGEDQTKSPMGIRSSAAAITTRVPPPNPPRTRDRGFSLRRSLFARNINDKAQASGSGMELQSGANFASHHGISQAGNQPPFENIARGTVTISPIAEDAKPRKVPEKENRPSLFLPHYETWVRSRVAETDFLGRLKHAYQKVKKNIFRIHNIPPSKDGRQLELDASRREFLTDERTGRVYIDNTIRSSRYTLWNFLPRQLFAQFSKLANFYFLSVSILQMIPGLSTTGNYTTIVPLSFFVALSMAKEGYDDFRRYRLDKAENNSMASVLHSYKPIVSTTEGSDEPLPITSAPKHWVNKKWGDVRVGDVVRLMRNEAAPADLVVLHAAGVNGSAYIETMALDGETNLKSKQALSPLAKICKSAEDIAGCKALFVVEDPNLDLYNFEGKCSVADETLPLTNNDIVYRGSILRNTAELYGIVIYTGEECKIRMNATKNPRVKAPALQAVVNKVVIIIVLFVLVLAIFNTIAYQIWYKTTERKAWYLKKARVQFFPILASFIILFNTMIPLSLYVSLEIIKLFQLVFMNDINMYDEDSNTPMEARTSTINEELGQVNYIFTDKTGTLTNNSMQFRKMSVAGTAWLHDLDIHEETTEDPVRAAISAKAPCKRKTPMRCRKSLSIRGQPRKVSDASSPTGPPLDGSFVGRKSSVSSRWKPQVRPNAPQPTLRTSEFLSYIQSRPRSIFARKARMFMLAIALCHTCIPERGENGETSYQATSPDEQALVQAAQELGYMVIDRQSSTITLKIASPDGEGDSLFEIYQILDVIEFSSSRKRMSIIVRMPDNRISVFCKGADSTIAQLLRLSDLAVEKAIMVERRVSIRQSLEAQEALRRDNDQRIQKARLSLSMNRHSLGAISRPSLQIKRLQPIRDNFDNWLRNREIDVDIASGDNQHAYSPRSSAYIAASPTVSHFSGGSSFQADERDDLVDEALVVDDAAVFERCFRHINDFATEGLRTLLYGFRFLEEDEYQSWKKIYIDASTSLCNRQEMVERAGALVETNLELAGATAIEDKLQEGVPDAIDKLRRAKIRLWMLTGDKRETAINIGHSCRLIKDYSSITILDHKTGDVDQRIAAAFVNINRGQVAHSVIIIDGQTLALIEANETMRDLFTDLAILVDSVICCRASPSQKAYLVGAIRTKVKNAVTLAIGDGANDIAMIQESHVGIGITGKEGLQAARISDYSIAQFRFLLRLLLVHGRWNYVRTCKYTLGTFWKEMLFYLTQALYQRFAGYTGTSLYESWSLSMFNTLFTSLPVIFMGIFEKDLEATTLLAVPELYSLGQHNGGFNLLIYASWMFMASSEAMIVFFVMLSLYGKALFTTDNGLYAMGTLTFSACVVVIATKMQFLDLHNKTITCAAAMFLSIGGWCLWNLILSALYSNNGVYNVREGLLQRFGRNALWWLTLILIVVAFCAFEVAVKSLRIAWAPDDVDVFQELEKDEGVRKRLKAAAAASGMTFDEGEDEQIKKREQEEEEEEARREEYVRELLERPRALMGVEGVAMRRKRLSDGSAGPVSWSVEAMTTTTKEDTVPLVGLDDDHDGAKTKRKSAARQSVDVHDFLRRGFGSVRRSLDFGTTTVTQQH